MNLLFTCAGRRNYLINYFKEALNGAGKVIATDMQMSAPAMNDADIAVVVPSIYDENYINSLLEVIQKHDVKAVISLNDLELPILSGNKQTIENLGARLIVSSEKVIDITFDKVKTAHFLKSIGIKTPDTFTNLQEAKTKIAQKELNFPLVVKPRWGSASIGIDFPLDEEELDLSFRLQQLKLKRTILNDVSKSDYENALLIQQKINGKEYGMDILNDFEGNYIGTFVREKLAMRSGETDKAISVIDERFNVIGKTISENLKHIGNLDCDVLEMNGELYVLEMNARFGGGYPFSHEAGVNTPKIYIELLKDSKDFQHYINYQSGKLFSKCDRLIEIK
jgi:carbamoyl-phosphate synthase large subunit